MSRKPFEWRYRAKASEEMLEKILTCKTFVDFQIISAHLDRVRRWEGFRQDDDTQVEVMVAGVIHHCDPEVKRQMDELEAAIDKTKPKGKSRWIPCTERMPEEGMFFLAYGPSLGEYVDGPTVEICRMTLGTLWNEGGTELWTGRPMTHWMPLPEGPE